MKRVILKPGEEGRILRGSPWVYDNEAGSVLDREGPAALVPGEAVDVESAGKVYLGRGFANPHSRILVRLYSSSKEGADKGFFKRRLREALARRSPFYDEGRDSFRMAFAEADMLPGFLADRYCGWPLDEFSRLPEGANFDEAASSLGPPRLWLSLQFLCYGMDARRELILSALAEVLPALSGIFDRTPPRLRELEGIDEKPIVIGGRLPEGGLVIFEGETPLAIKPAEGQKTGFYLDQRGNRLKTASLAKGRRVLDLCCNTGAFSMQALRGGAQSVLGVDASEAALEGFALNARLNAAGDRASAIRGDVFEALPRLEARREKFDLIVLDPPAFAKSRSAAENALRGYRELNRRAIGLLAPGGILVSCSCSQAVGEGSFKAMITRAAADADRRLVQLDFCGAGPDHPVLTGHSESEYLKCGFYQAL
jgi:23S rRNA (cytosine1962-C5)-methyltransferase